MTTPMYVRSANGNCLIVDPNSTQSYIYKPVLTNILYFSYPDLVNTSAEFSNETPTYIKPIPSTGYAVDASVWANHGTKEGNLPDFAFTNQPSNQPSIYRQFGDEKEVIKPVNNEKETFKSEHIMTDTTEFDDQSKMVFCKFPTEEKKVESIDELFENSELFANLGNGDLAKDKAKDFAKDLAKDKEIFIDAIDKTIKRQSIGEAKIISMTTMPFSAIVSIEIFTHDDDLSVKKQTKFVTTTNPAKFTQLINRTFANLNQHIINLEDELSDLSY